MVHALVALVALGSAPGSADSIPWQSNFDSAKKVAATAKKPILIYFTTDWCGYCKVMERESFGLPDVVKHADKYVPVKLDAEKGGVKLAKKLGVSAYPTFVILAADEKELGRVKGYKSARDYMAEIDQILGGDAPKVYWERRLKAKPNDGVAHAELAQFYANDLKIESAEKHLEQAEAAGYRGKPMPTAFLKVGKAYQRTDFEKSRKYLMKAIELRDATILSEAYEALMGAVIYGNKREEMPNVARLMVNDTLLEASMRARAARTVLEHEMTAEVATPDALLTTLLKECNGQKNRNPDRFKVLFDRSPLVSSVHRSNLGNGELVISVDTWLETMAYDKFDAKLVETGRQVVENRIVAHGWVDYNSTITDRNGKPFESKGRFWVTMIHQAPRWYIKSLVNETIRD